MKSIRNSGVLLAGAVLGVLGVGLLMGPIGCSIQASKDADAQFASASDRPPTAHTLYASSELLAARGRDDEAFWVLQRINRDYPDYVPAYNGVAEYQMRRNHVGEAIAALKAGLKIAPDDPVLLNNLGMCAMMQADYDQALTHFTRAASVAPGNARYRANMATALGMMGRYDEALAVYQQVVEDEDAHFNVGVLAESRGDKVRAQREFALAEEIGHQRHLHMDAKVKTAPEAAGPSATPSPAPPAKPSPSAPASK